MGLVVVFFCLELQQKCQQVHYKVFVIIYKIPEIIGRVTVREIVTARNTRAFFVLRERHVG